MTPEKKQEVATFANGCFWCTEGVFKRISGVLAVVSGYTGGTTENPSYDQVSSGKTGHAEAIQITFNPEVVSYDTLLEIFWHTHNPTTLNQQGADIGTQYRSAIFYHTDEQRKKAETSKEKLSASDMYHDPIVTEIVPLTTFYPAEAHHQNYYDKNRQYPYCTVVIDPKIRKLMSEFAHQVKDVYQ